MLITKCTKYINITTESVYKENTCCAINTKTHDCNNILFISVPQAISGIFIGKQYIDNTMLIEMAIITV